MKILSVLVLGVMLIYAALLAGCSEKPESAIQSSKTAIDEAVSVGAEKYAKEEVKVLQDELIAAMEEVEAQDKKIFRNFDAANRMLALVQTKAATLKEEVPARKEKAKNSAQTALDEATAAVTSASELLVKAPKGKGSMADIQALEADVAGLRETLGEIQNRMSSEDYTDAAAKAESVRENASAVSDQITQALIKTGKASE